MPTSSGLAERDLKVVWHPCTQMKDHEWLPMVPSLVATARRGMEAATCD